MTKVWEEIKRKQFVTNTNNERALREKYEQFLKEGEGGLEG